MFFSWKQSERSYFNFVILCSEREEEEEEEEDVMWYDVTSNDKNAEKNTSNDLFILHECNDVYDNTLRQRFSQSYYRKD